MRNLTRFCFQWTALFALLLFVGCGAEDGLKLVPVSGKVTVDGEPLPNAGISFRPDTSKGNTTGHQPSASADEQGHYELKTAGKTGAPPGWYKVVVFPYAPPPGSDQSSQGSALQFDRKYNDPETTDLTVEVKEGEGPVTYDIDLTPAG